MRNVLVVPEPSLHQPVRGVESFDSDLRALVEEMFLILDASKGVGLAANQIGVSQEVAVIRFEGKDYTLINAYPIYWSGQNLGIEGCLSLPGKLLAFTRMDMILVKYRGLDGSDRMMHATGMLARIVQHELDHLNGTLITDYEEPDTSSIKTIAARARRTIESRDRTHTRHLA